MGAAGDPLAPGLMRVAIEEKRFHETRILGPLDFETGAHEVVALLGPSGIGKTTLLRLIAGLDRDFAGSIEGAGRISMVFQEPRLLPWRSAAENVCLAARVGQAEADRLLSEVGLDGRGDAFPGQLSLGQQRRVALARAFAVRPETLLLDEPFVSLDPGASLRMQGLLAQLLSAHPARAILVTHAAEEAARLADRVLRLDGPPGRIVADERLAAPRQERDADWIAATATRLAAAAAHEGVIPAPDRNAI
jgi:NitT/TauT family transport system ATP-binding protein